MNKKNKKKYLRKKRNHFREVRERIMSFPEIKTPNEKVWILRKLLGD